MQVSTSSNNYQKLPISFKTVYAYSGIITSSSYGGAGCWIERVTNTQYISGIGQDFMSASDEKISAIFIGI